MAWIFALLLLLNGAYWAYEVYVDAPPPTVDLNKQVSLPGLKLYHEGESALPAPSQMAAAAASTASSSSPPGCFLLGPLSASQADLTRKDLAAQGLVALLLPQDMNSQGVWVYIPPVQYIADATATAARLQAQGEPAEVVAQGEFAGAVSIGHYHTQGAATAAVQALVNKGYAAESRVETVPADQSWIYVAPVTQADQDKLTSWMHAHRPLHQEGISCT